MSQRASYDGPALDATGQHISEAPYWRDGETVDVATDEKTGELTAENVPVPDGGAQRPDDADGQTTLDDWGRSA